jgi:hypothetical protein
MILKPITTLRLHGFEFIQGSKTAIGKRHIGQGQTRFKVRDVVRLIRPDLFGFIPTGSTGVIVGIDEEDGYFAMKGTPSRIQFPSTKKLKDILRPEQIATLGLNPDEPMRFSETFFGPNDIQQIDARPDETSVQGRADQPRRSKPS